MGNSVLNVVQYNNFPDTPAAPGADGQQVGTRAETTGSSDGAPVPAVPQQRTRIFGSVLNKLTVKSPEEAGGLSPKSPAISIPSDLINPCGISCRHCIIMPKLVGVTDVTLPLRQDSRF